uniref:HTH myb-type domain-containing protein n=2 Tax=Aegilops tauschii subsp. strangulata TaxID=200361 RepID=A0A453NAX4_AEGTS
MSHLLFLALLRTLMGCVCLQRRTDSSIKNHWNISLRKKLDIYGTRSILAIPRLIGLDDFKYKQKTAASEGRLDLNNSSF